MKGRKGGREGEKETNKLMNIICLHYNLEGPGSNLKLSAPQEHSRTQLIRRAGLQPHPSFLSTLALSCILSSLTDVHIDVLAQHPIGHSFPLEVPTLTVPNALRKIDRGRGLRRLCMNSGPSGQGTLGSGISECGPEGEGVTPSSSRPLTHWGSRTFKIWPGLGVILHKQAALELESWIKQFQQCSFPLGLSQ